MCLGLIKYLIEGESIADERVSPSRGRFCSMTRPENVGLQTGQVTLLSNTQRRVTHLNTVH